MGFEEMIEDYPAQATKKSKYIEGEVTKVEQDLSYRKSLVTAQTERGKNESQVGFHKVDTSRIFNTTQDNKDNKVLIVNGTEVNQRGDQTINVEDASERQITESIIPSKMDAIGVDIEIDDLNTSNPHSRQKNLRDVLRGTKKEKAKTPSFFENKEIVLDNSVANRIRTENPRKEDDDLRIDKRIEFLFKNVLEEIEEVEAEPLDFPVVDFNQSKPNSPAQKSPTRAKAAKIQKGKKLDRDKNES